MSGNWATGRRQLNTAPELTKKIAITIATMGWLMKNFDIVLALAAGSGWRLGRRRLWGHHLRLSLDPVRDFLQALGDDALAHRHSLVDNPEVAHLLADLHHAQRNLVVRADHADLVLALSLEHGALRHEQRVLAHIGSRANLRIQSGAKNVVRIREDSLNLDGAGLDV